LLLGDTFAWADLLAYLIGIAAGVGLEYLAVLYARQYMEEKA